MGTSYITCYDDTELTPHNLEERGFWAHDPYTSILMQLVGRDFVKDAADQWKQVVGAELMHTGKCGGDGCTFPPLHEYRDSEKHLLAFRDGYQHVDRFLASFGDVLPDKFLRDNDMKGPLLRGSDDVPIREVRNEAQQVIKLIDDFLKRTFHSETE